jgi:flagellar biogenesis protein FliO
METSAVALVVRLVISLGVVLLLMMGAAALLRKRAMPGSGGVARRRTVTPIEVMARQGLGKTASVAVVRAGGKALVLGITDSSINLLAEADPASFEIDTPERQGTAAPGSEHRSGSAWMAFVDTLRERTVRR